uniref:Asteroid domain-containing protein n=1 Tax=Salarias fasciatus TaxID=181472 RepID=A0A672HEQ9_SALFA
MGVHGLTSYVEGHRHLLKDVKLRDSRLVIDGSSLYYRLYFNSGLDQQRGGDYDQFSLRLQQFFSALKTCSIQPYVVLDGGMDPSDKKFATLRQRLQSKIKEADQLAHGRSGSVLPILTRHVLIQVLTQMGVPLVQCPAEADWEIACLARQWNCPVLTSDSDFYIFDLPGGYLPFQFFRWNHLSGNASNRYISARCYTVSGLCQWFGSIHHETLALAAVLIGNDYGAPKEANKVFAMLNENSFSGRGGGSASRIDGLLLWLFSFRNVAEALEDVSAFMAGGNKGQVGVITHKLREAMQEYSIDSPSSLARWFSGAGSAVLGGQISLLPQCLSLVAAQGLLPQWVIDVLVKHRAMLIAQVENSKLASSHCVSETIRQAVYAILLQKPRAGGGPQQAAGPQGGRGGRGRGGAAPLFVEEYDRLDLNMKIKSVAVQPLRNHLHLEGIAEVNLKRKLVLLETLGYQSPLCLLFPHMQLAVAVTAFWMQNATPKPSQPQLQALLLCMVYGELSRIFQPEARGVQPGLDRQRVRAGERRGLDLAVAHGFSQWQACLWSSLCLNQLLLLPLPAPHLPRLFSGTLAHGLVRYLKGGRPAESLLPVGSFSGKLYASLLSSVKSCVSGRWVLLVDGQENRGRGQGRRGRGGGGRGRGRGRGAQGRGGGVDELANRFALLMSEEEFDDD